MMNLEKELLRGTTSLKGKNLASPKFGRPNENLASLQIFFLERKKKLPKV